MFTLEMRLTSILRIMERDPKTYGLGIVERLGRDFRIEKFTMFLTKDRDLTLKGIKKRATAREQQAYYDLNKISRKKLMKYGPELYAAYFTCYLQGKARFEGSNKWIIFDERRNEDNILPETYFSVKVDGLDFSHTILNNTGLDNIEQCEHLKTLILRNCPFVDEFSLSTIAGTFSETLEILDLTSNKNLTDNGLLSLGKLNNLKQLNLKHTKPCPNMEYICALLEVEFPDLEITGFDFKSEKAIDKVKRKLEEEDKALNESFKAYDENNKQFFEFLKKRSEFIKKNNF